MTRESPASAGRVARSDSLPRRESSDPALRVPHPDTASPASEHGESRVPARRVPHLGTASPASARPGEPVPADLAARQAALVAALVAGAPDPAGFDAERLAAARRALLRKRSAAAAALWPLLAASLEPDWPAVFAASVEGRAPAGALVDGWELARALHRRRELGDTAAVELAEREVAMHYDGHRAPRPRRGPALRRVGRLVLLQLGGRVVRFGR